MTSKIFDTPSAAYSVDGFCAAHGISRGTLYNRWRDGTGPKYMQVGHRRLISVEAAEAWRREREAAAAA
jgi:predicted DNA-binding transcriptional regulator AlpA